MTFSSDEDVGGSHEVLGGCRLVMSMCGRVRVYITLQFFIELCTSDFLRISRYKVCRQVGLRAKNHLVRTETAITAGPGPQA